MELLIAIAVVFYVSKIGVEDLSFAVRGKTSPRHQARLIRARGRTSRSGAGPARAYLGELWDDAWQTAGANHRRRRAARQACPPRPQRPTGPARSYLRNRAHNAHGAMSRRWAAGWERAEARHQRRYERRHPPATATSPSNDGEDRCSCGGQFRQVDGTEHYDADGRAMVDTRCDRCGTESADYFAWDPPEDDDLGDPETPEAEPSGTTNPRNPTTEGEPHMSTANGEVTGLRSAIGYAEDLAGQADEAVTALETLSAGLTAGGTGENTVGKFTTAGEHLSAASAQLRDAARELSNHLPVTEAYEATGNEAGEKSFVTAD